MPSPRFDKLESNKQAAILGAAAQEFGEHGFQGASYNRIIAAAGISKGAMYYYFADKEDLYRTVLDAALRSFIKQMSMPKGIDSAEAYWRECESIYADIMRFLLAEPHAAALCWSVSRVRERGESHPILVEMSQRLETWTGALISLGQSVGAVRTDLPSDLLLYTGFAMLEGMDRWLASHWDDMTPERVDATTRMLIGLLRRIAEPTTTEEERQS